MSKRLDETIGAVGFDNLINGQYPPAEVFTVKIRKEATEDQNLQARHCSGTLRRYRRRRLARDSRYRCEKATRH